VTAKTAQPAPVESIQIGDIRLTYLVDGEAVMAPTVVFPNSNQAMWDAHPEYLEPGGQILASMGGFLIESGDRKVIVDLGFGDASVEFPGVGTLTGGRLLDRLKQTGVSPSDIDAVVYTHMHLDHVGWTAVGGEITFPNAEHFAGRGEWDFWHHATDEALVTVGPHPEAIQPALESRMEPVDDGASIAPGVTAISTPGHTPGHTSLVISSGTDRAVIMGDVIACPLQFDESDVGFLFDLDPELAKRTRQRMERELEQPGTIGANGHYAGTVFGRVMQGQGKRWHQLS